MAWVIERKGAKGTSYMACYRDPTGKQRSAGSYTTRRAAERAAAREELKVNDGHWHDPTPGKITFRDYVQTAWLPSRHIEPSTLAGYQSYLNRQFYPFFGAMPMNKILPSHIQEWVTAAA
ncbi:MAG TPA: N-terminal phage integrase SAM-like domain-containing protein, partial [Nocardioidaceae bacterium]|nr:N-terminal phage integrase SAM-like domain-containing protein [Nocardioidaceae bacterium]